MENFSVPRDGIHVHQDHVIEGANEDHQNVSDDDGMDTDSDGGVLLDSAQAITSDQFKLSDTLEIKRTYHQIAQKELTSLKCSWRLPVAPSTYTRRQLKQSNDHPIVIAYTKHCTLISRHWKCNPEECFPAELRNHTPFSFALLSSLRQLASLTKQNAKLAHSLLLQSQLTRASIDEGDIYFVETFVTGKSVFSMKEDKIWENPSGLMLCDVSQAVQHIRILQKAQRQAKKGQLKASRHTARQQAKLTRESSHNEHPRSTTARKVAARRKNRQNAKIEAAVASSTDELVGFQIGSVNRNPLSLGDPFEPRFGAHEQHQDKQINQMSKFLNTIHFNNQRPMRPRRAKQLQAGGSSRESHKKISMPSEKIELAGVPPLTTIASATNERTLARLGQLRLSDQATSPSRTELIYRESRDNGDD